MTSRESFSYPTISKLQGGDAVRSAGHVARTFGEALQLSSDDQSRLCIIVEELVANLYEHGGLGDPDVVELCLGSEFDGICIRITDPGPPFDPRLAAPKPMPIRGGGAGIELVRSWANILAYEVTPEGNRLELLMPIEWHG